MSGILKSPCIYNFCKHFYCINIFKSWKSLYPLVGQTITRDLFTPDGTPLLLELRFTERSGDIRIEGSLDSASHWRLERLEELIVIRGRDVFEYVSECVLRKNEELHRRLSAS